MSETAEVEAEVELVTARHDGGTEVSSKEIEVVTSEVRVSDGKDEGQTEIAGSKQLQDDREDDASETNASQPVAKQLLERKFRCFDPTDTVDIVVGESDIQAIKPVTIPQFFQRICDKVPNGAALCWKDKKEDPWQTLTYIQYKKLIYNVAKSFLKVMY